MKKKAKTKVKVRITKFEKILYTFSIILLISSPIAIVFAKSTLSEVNYEVEKIKKQISTKEKENESLEMEKNELASLDNIQKVIKDYGLTFNNDNIKNID